MPNRNALAIALVMAATIALPATASEVHLIPLEKTAKDIKCVLRVMVTDVKRVTNYMKLKDGSQGPWTSKSTIVTGDVWEVVWGQCSHKTIRTNYTEPSLILYDENGKKVGHCSIKMPDPGIADIHKGKEYLFSYTSVLPPQRDDGKPPTAFHARIDPVSAKEKFIKLLKGDNESTSGAAKCRARYYAARFALDHRPEYAIPLCNDILARDNVEYSNKVWDVIGEAQNRLANHREAAKAFHHSGDQFNESLALFNESLALFDAGEYQRAVKLFEAEMAVPEEPVQGKFMEATPKTVRCRIWIARCRGRLGEKTVAFSQCLELAQQRAALSRGRWKEEDEISLAKTLVENAQSASDWTTLHKLSQNTHIFKQLVEYFRAKKLIDQKDARGVALYLTKSDVPLAHVKPTIWHDEILDLDDSMKPALINYMREQFIKAGKWGDTDIIMYHVNNLLRSIHDKSLVQPVLGSHQLRRRFPDDYRKWKMTLGKYRSECKGTALSLLKGDRESKEHALDLINDLKLYDREALDAIAFVAAEEYYPTQVRSLLTFWRVSGQQFGLEADTNESALEQASDSERKEALARAIEWWKGKRESIKPGTRLPVAADDKAALPQGLRCSVAAIRNDAIARLVAQGDKSVLALEMNVVSNPNRISPLFFSHPQETIEHLIKYGNFSTVSRMTGVTHPDKEAWSRWWKANRGAWDFAATARSKSAR